MGKKNIILPTPLYFWLSLTPWTRRITVIVTGVIVVAAMITGNLETLIAIFASEKGG